MFQILGIRLIEKKRNDFTFLNTMTLVYLNFQENQSNLTSVEYNLATDNL